MTHLYAGTPNCRDAKQPWHTWCEPCKRQFSEFDKFPMAYEPGSQVVVRTVDMEGLQGRDPHPDEQHVGMSGVVLAFVDRDFSLVSLPDSPIDFYLVQLGTFEQFQFADYELEPAPRVGTANESKPATLGVAGNPQNEPTGDSHMSAEPTEEQSMNAQMRSIRELFRRGWNVNNIFEDGNVCMSKTYYNTDDVMVLIMPSGVIRKPYMAATLTAEGDIDELLSELGGETNSNGWVPPWS